MAGGPKALGEGLWSWSCQHPEWHPGNFGAEVISFACRAPGALLLIDPLLPDDDEEKAAALELIDAEAADRVAILITIPYHVRSAEQLWGRCRGDAEVTIHGHPACEKHLGEATDAFSAIEAGVELPGSAMPHTIGKPRRFETPIHLPSQKALVFGDAVVGIDGGLRMWAMRKPDAAHRRFYRERFSPTLAPLLDLDLKRILVTHGPSVLSDGSEALRAAVEADPWYHRG